MPACYIHVLVTYASHTVPSLHMTVCECISCSVFHRSLSPHRNKREKGEKREKELCSCLIDSGRPFSHADSEEEKCVYSGSILSLGLELEQNNFMNWIERGRNNFPNHECLCFHSPGSCCRNTFSSLSLTICMFMRLFAFAIENRSFCMHAYFFSLSSLSVS